MKKVKVLGTGCKKCHTLYDMVVEVQKSTGIEMEIEKIEDIVEIMNYGIMGTPALIVDEKLLFAGRLPKKKELAELLSK